VVREGRMESDGQFSFLIGAPRRVRDMVID
jgi:hypothetical protein